MRSECRKCRAIYRKKHNKQTREYFREWQVKNPGYRVKYITNQLKNNPIERKKILARRKAGHHYKVSQPCEVCGKKAQKHHPDYNEPLKVQWLCRKHHMDLHKNN